MIMIMAILLMRRKILYDYDYGNITHENDNIVWLRNGNVTNDDDKLYNYNNVNVTYDNDKVTYNYNNKNIACNNDKYYSIMIIR